VKLKNHFVDFHPIIMMQLYVKIRTFLKES